MNQKIAVNARKPGISRTDCKRPISQPVNPAASLAKLLRSACQLAKLIQLRKVTVIRNVTGEPKKRWREVTGEGTVIHASGTRGQRRTERRPNEIAPFLILHEYRPGSLMSAGEQCLS